MKKTAQARFAIQSWDEKPYSEAQNQPKLIRASVTKIYTGDIEGEGQVEYLMMYRTDGSPRRRRLVRWTRYGASFHPSYELN